MVVGEIWQMTRARLHCLDVEASYHKYTFKMFVLIGYGRVLKLILPQEYS